MVRWRSILCLWPTTCGGAIAGEVPIWRELDRIFIERCCKCHPFQGTSKGLRLDAPDAALAGGATGAVLIAGNTDASELLRRLRGESLPRMPFLGRLLLPEQIELTIWGAAPS